MKEFFTIMEKVWPQILSLEKQYQLIKVYKDKILIVK
jgi:hypothetical protein